jgi:hypothetical protein
MTYTNERKPFSFVSILYNLGNTNISDIFTEEMKGTGHFVELLYI